MARLPDGTWSPPSAIMTGGAGVGGQVGAELTDFVFVLNDYAAVESFAQMGSITLGANVSVAAGPLGRNAEGAGTASLKNVSAVFAYSKTKGLFAGISVEGSAIIERRDANKKFYGSRGTAKCILTGEFDPPPACEPLLRVLESRVFNNSLPYEDDFYNDSYYDDIPDEFSDSTSEYSRGGMGARRASRYSRQRRSSGYGYSDEDYSDDDYDTYGGGRRGSHRRPHGREPFRGSGRGSAWEDDVYDHRGHNRRRQGSDVDDMNSRFRNTRLSSTNSPMKPPASSKPDNGAYGKSNANQAIALYSFKGEQSGDLSFKKGDVIDILKKSNTTDDWWTGRNNGATGIFPANYVELI